MPLDSIHLLKTEVALDALLKAYDLQQHVQELHGRLMRISAIHGLSNELEATVLTRKVKAVGDAIVGDFRVIQMYIVHLEKLLSGQEPFAVVPPPRRRRRNTPPSLPLSKNPEEGEE